MPNQKPIVRVIRNKTTGEFLTESGWTKDFDQAIRFRDGFHAVEACQKYQLKEAELVLRFEHNELDVAVPICSQN